MKLEKQLADALNKQVNIELSASHNYLAMATYFDDLGLAGFAAWFRDQAQEENEHGMRLYNFLVRRDSRVLLEAIKQPKSEFQSPLAALNAALDMEQEVSQSINDLYALSQDVKDHATTHMLGWFLDEQVEEEDTFRNLIDKTAAAEGNRWHLLVLDKELGSSAQAQAA